MCDKENIIAQASVEQPYKFVLGARTVIKGFETAVRSLSIGGKANFLIPSDQAYGKVGCPPHILNDEDLYIEIEVISVKTVD